jgi:spermidine synthase
VNRARQLALVLMAASGFAALGYQIVWTQQSAVWLGHESAAVLAVVAAFFGGLGTGALALSPRIERSRRPSHWYAACEIVIGSWSVALAFLIAPASRWLLGIIGAQPSATWQWSVAFVGTFVLLLPATAAMGATMPAMERAIARLGRHGSSIGALYAMNTLGAMVGVLAAAFFLVPAFGLVRTAAICAVLNLLCAALMIVLFQAADDDAGPTPDSAPARAVPWLLAFTGLLGIGYEVLVVRVLSQVAENTVYTFAMLLAVYLAGTALGAAAYQRWRGGVGPGGGVPADLFWFAAAACLSGTVTLWFAESGKTAITHALGSSMAAALCGEAAVAVAAFLVPTIAMGALFCHLCFEAREAGVGFGRSLGINTLGAAAAPVVFGVLLMPALGHKTSLLLVVAGYLALAAWRKSFASGAWATAITAAALAFAAPPLAFVDVPEGGRIISYREGAMAAVSVVEDAAGIARLRIDNRQQEGSSGTLLADARQALLPMLLHPSPRRALFLGLGTGVTASSAADDTDLQVYAVELLPEVIEASGYFRRDLPGGTQNPRLHLMRADARRFVRATDQQYDLIVSDNFHPARSGSGALYTVEHFAAVRGRLADDGLFCQWLPLHQLDLATLRSIVRSFIDVFPDGWAMLATNSLETPVLGLVARADGGRFDVDRIRTRLAGVSLPQGPAQFGINDELALLGGFVAGPRALARFSGGAPLNTDDHPVVAYMAPRITYVPDSRPRDRLLAFLEEVEIAPDELAAGDAGTEFDARLAAYWSARDRFIAAGRDVQPSADVRRMLAQVGGPLLDVLHISPDFRPAYDPLLQMAVALGREDAPAACRWLADLRRAQPARDEAITAMDRISCRQIQESGRAVRAGRRLALHLSGSDADESTPDWQAVNVSRPDLEPGSAGI